MVLHCFFDINLFSCAAHATCLILKAGLAMCMFNLAAGLNYTSAKSSRRPISTSLITKLWLIWCGSGHLSRCQVAFILQALAGIFFCFLTYSGTNYASHPNHEILLHTRLLISLGLLLMNPFWYTDVMISSLKSFVYHCSPAKREGLRCQDDESVWWSLPCLFDRQFLEAPNPIPPLLILIGQMQPHATEKPRM